jgi:hypothetical protein
MTVVVSCIQLVAYYSGNVQHLPSVAAVHTSAEILVSCQTGIKTDLNTHVQILNNGEIVPQCIVYLLAYFG